MGEEFGALWEKVLVNLCQKEMQNRSVRFSSSSSSSFVIFEALSVANLLLHTTGSALFLSSIWASVRTFKDENDGPVFIDF